MVQAGRGEHRQCEHHTRIVRRCAFEQHRFEHRENDHLIRMDNPFWISGRPAGVEDDRGVRGRHLRFQRGGVMIAQVVHRRHGNEVQLRSQIRDRAQFRHLLVVRQHEPRRRVADEILQLVGWIARVRRRDDRADLHQGDSGDAPFHRTLAGDRDHVAGADTPLVDQPMRDAVSPTVQLRIGELVVFHDQSDMIRPSTNPPAECMCEKKRHRVSLPSGV